MNLAGWRFLVFALIGAAGIVVLASIGVPARKDQDLDRHTGEERLVVRNVADAYFDTRSTGEANRALERALQHREDFPEHPALARVIAILEAELAGPDAAPSPFHPAAETVVAEQRRARNARKLLDQRLREHMNKQAVLALLDHIEADEAVAEATEEFFGPLALWPPTDVPNPEKADEWAARYRKKLAGIAAVEEPALFLQASDAFRAIGRPRARLRWLLRAYAALPPAHDLHDELIAAYLESGRLKEAFLVVGAALQSAPDDLDLWRLRARIAGWISLPGEEAEACEVLLEAEQDDVARRERLVQLYTFTGRSDRAVPHLRELARGSTDREVLERPAQYALSGGQVDLALEILEELARETGEPAFWRERIITYSRQNLDFERVEAELNKLREIDPRSRDGYEQRLVTIYRRTDATTRLVALLEERLARNPSDRELERQVLDLHTGLGNEQRVREIMLARIDREADPAAFFARLRTYRALSLAGLGQRAVDLAKSPALKREDTGLAIDNLRPLFDRDEAYREAALIMARRFPGEETSRILLLERIDHLGGDPERARAAERLAREHAGDPAYIKAWVERASWAGDPEAETRAREAWMEHAPADHGNRRALANLYTAHNRAADALVQWRFLADREGLESPAVLNLIDALMSVGETEEAIRWLEQRASLPDTGVSDRLYVAGELFGRQLFDRALRFYLAVLDLDENEPEALLRIGQIRSWTNDPRGAVPFLERRLEVSDEEAAEVRFYLGEAYWATREDDKGKRYHRESLEELEQRTERTATQELMVAKMLTRFGRDEEAQPIFERLLATHPDNIDLILDYGDSMVATRNIAKARELVESAKAMAPLRARVMRLDGKVAMEENRFTEAATILAAAIERHGTDAGTESELGRAHELSGERLPALLAYERSLILQPANTDVDQSRQRLADELAHVGDGSLWLRTVDRDRAWGVSAGATTPWSDDRTRLAISVGYSAFDGRAAAVDDGLTGVTANVFPVRVSAFRRFRRLNQFGGGIDVYPGAEGDVPIGGWAGLLLKDQDPYRVFGVRLLAHTLWTNPAAAPGLGGRRSAALVFGQQGIGTRFWAGFELGLESLSIEDPLTGGTAQDGRFTGSAVFGVRLHRGDQRVGEQLRLDRNTVPGLVGPYLAADPSATRSPLVSVWGVYQSLRLLGDRELAALLPIGERFDYLGAAGRADFHVARGLGAMVEVAAGYEFVERQPFGNIDAGLTWRPTRKKLELTVRGGWGRDFTRSDGADAFRLGIDLRYRW